MLRAVLVPPTPETRPARTAARGAALCAMLLASFPPPARAGPAVPAPPSPADGPDRAGVAAPALDGPDALAAAVLAANPELTAAEERIAALEHAVTQAGVWPDPVASVENSNVPLEEPYPGGHPMSGVQLRVQQTIPFPGKTSARAAVARSRVTTARHELAETRNRLAGMVRDLYHRLALVRQLRDVTVRHVAAVEELVTVVRARYETGGAPQHDLLRLVVLRDRLADDLGDFTRSDRELVAALVAAAHLPPETPIATPERTPLPPEAPGLEAVVARLAEERPALRILASRADTAELAADRAEAERRPDVTLWLGSRWRRPAGADAGDELYSAGVSIPLPWFWNDRRWGALEREERARARAFEAERTARLDEIRGRVDAALARWRRGREKARVYGDALVPAQRRTLESALAAYRAGRAQFETLYRAELELLDLERALRNAHADAARAEVDAATLAGEYAGPPNGDDAGEVTR